MTRLSRESLTTLRQRERAVSRKRVLEAASCLAVTLSCRCVSSACSAGTNDVSFAFCRGKLLSCCASGAACEPECVCVSSLAPESLPLVESGQLIRGLAFPGRERGGEGGRGRGRERVTSGMRSRKGKRAGLPCPFFLLFSPFVSVSRSKVFVSSLELMSRVHFLHQVFAHLPLHLLSTAALLLCVSLPSLPLLLFPSFPSLTALVSLTHSCRRRGNSHDDDVDERTGGGGRGFARRILIVRRRRRRPPTQSVRLLPRQSRALPTKGHRIERRGQKNGLKE